MRFFPLSSLLFSVPFSSLAPSCSPLFFSTSFPSPSPPVALSSPSLSHIQPLFFLFLCYFSLLLPVVHPPPLSLFTLVLFKLPFLYPVSLYSKVFRVSMLIYFLTLVTKKCLPIFLLFIYYVFLPVPFSVSFFFLLLIYVFFFPVSSFVFPSCT